jgi:hypothetical protein
LSRSTIPDVSIRRRRPARLLNPFGGVERRMQADRQAAAVAVVEAAEPGLHDLQPRWFGGGLEGDVRARYVAVGFLAAPDDGLDEGRAYVVDIRTGHVLVRRPLERRSDLPRSITALGG